MQSSPCWAIQEKHTIPYQRIWNRMSILYLNFDYFSILRLRVTYYWDKHANMWMFFYQLCQLIHLIGASDAMQMAHYKLTIIIIIIIIIINPSKCHTNPEITIANISNTKAIDVFIFQTWNISELNEWGKIFGVPLISITYWMWSRFKRQ